MTNDDLQKRKDARATAYKFKYSLRFPEVSRHTTSLGYIHDLELIVCAVDPEDALEMLQKWHSDGAVEGARVEAIGQVICGQL